MPTNPHAKCYDLATRFIEDYYPHLDDDRRANALANIIHETILAWLVREHDNYEPPTGAPQDDPDFAGFANNH